MTEKEVLKITAKELKSAGFNDYYIKKAIDDNLIERVERGKYNIIKTKNIENGKKYFSMFAECVFNRDFKNAFENLYKAHTLQDNLYSNSYRICFLLLKELVGDKYDFSFVDDILIFCDMNDTDNEFVSLLNQFIYDVMAKDYYSASRNISKLKSLHNERRKIIPVSINIFSILADEVIKKQKLNNKKNSSLSFEHIFSILKIYLKKEEYEGALEFLEKQDDAILNKNKEAILIVKNLLKKYLDMKNKEEVLVENKASYSETSDHYKNCYKNIVNGNYIEAYKEANALVYYYPQNEDFLLYKSLLEKIMKQNKINTKEDVISSNDKKSNELSNATHLSIFNISQLINEKQYSTLQNLLEDNGLDYKNNNRFYVILYRFLKQMERYRSGHFVVRDRKPYVYVNISCFSRFYEALSCCDTEEIYNRVIECEKFCKENRDGSTEFSLYRKVLEDLLIIEKNALFKKDINSQFNKIIFSKKGIACNLEKLEEILYKKIEFNSSCNDNEETVNDSKALDIIDMIKATYADSNITRDSFATYNYDDSNLAYSFMEALDKGSYVEAFELAQDNDWYTEIEKKEDRRYLILYKKLLAVLNKKLIDNETMIFDKPKIKVIDIFSDKIKMIHILENFIKHYEIDKAFSYYKDNYTFFKEVFNEELNASIMTNFHLFANWDVSFLEEHKSFYKKK